MESAATQTGSLMRLKSSLATDSQEECLDLR